RGTIPPGWVGFGRAPSALGWFTWAALFVIVVAFFLLGTATALLAPASTRADPARVAVFGLLEAAFALAAGAVLLRPVRHWIARALPLDPDSPVHTTALVLSVILLGTQVATQLTTNVLGQVTAGQRLQPV